MAKYLVFFPELFGLEPNPSTRRRNRTVSKKAGDVNNMATTKGKEQSISQHDHIDDKKTSKLGEKSGVLSTSSVKEHYNAVTLNRQYQQEVKRRCESSTACGDPLEPTVTANTQLQSPILTVCNQKKLSTFREIRPKPSSSLGSLSGRERTHPVGAYDSGAWLNAKGAIFSTERRDSGDNGGVAAYASSSAATGAMSPDVEKRERSSGTRPQPVKPSLDWDLPEGLSFKCVPSKTDDDEGSISVHAEQFIQAGRTFGPYKGNLMEEKEAYASNTSWELCLHEKVFLYIDGHTSAHSWMPHVMLARTEAEQNLEANQMNGEICFTATKFIEPGSELRVFYSNAYAKQAGFIAKLTELHFNEDTDKFSCPSCWIELPSAKLMVRHHKLAHDEREGANLQPFITWAPRTKNSSNEYPAEASLRDVSTNSATNGTELTPRATIQRRKPINCDQCDKIFYTEVKLMAHKAFHGNTEIAKCPVCGEEKANEFLMTRHIALHQESTLQCSKCPKKYRTRDALHAHERLHHNMRRRYHFTCTVCPAVFPRRDLATKHEQQVHGNVSAVAVGDPESRKGQSLKERARIRREAVKDPTLDRLLLHAALNSELVSSTKKSKRKDDMLKPVGSELTDFETTSLEYLCQDGGDDSSEKLKWSCRLCVRRYANAAELVAHSEDVHAGEGLHRCPHCPKLFAAIGTLQNHIVSHDSHKYKCELCPRLFSSEQALINHQGEHNGEKPFHCDVCQRGFRTKKLRAKHKRTVHQERELKYQCSFCEKRFPSRGNMAKHEQRHKGIKPCVCQTCGQAFYTNATLKMHTISKHTDVKPFECGVCGKRFVCNQGFRVHLALHKKRAEDGAMDSAQTQGNVQDSSDLLL